MKLSRFAGPAILGTFVTLGCTPKKISKSENLNQVSTADIAISDCKKSLLTDNSTQFFHDFIPAPILGGREFYVIGVLANLDDKKQSLGIGPIALGEHEALTQTINPNAKKKDVVWAGEIAFKSSNDCKSLSIIAANLTSGTYKLNKGISEALVPFLKKNFPAMVDTDFKQRGPLGAHILEPFNFFHSNFRHTVEGAFFNWKISWAQSLVDDSSKASTLKEFALDAKIGIHAKQFETLFGTNGHFKNKKNKLPSYLNQQLGKWTDAPARDALSPISNFGDLLGTSGIIAKIGDANRITLEPCLTQITHLNNQDPKSTEELIANMTCLDDLGWLLSKSSDDPVLKEMGEQILAENSAFVVDGLPIKISSPIQRTQLAMAGSGSQVQALRTYLSYALLDFKASGQRFRVISKNLDRLNRMAASISNPKAEPLNVLDFEELKIFLRNLKNIVYMDPKPTAYGEGGEVIAYKATDYLQ